MAPAAGASLHIHNSTPSTAGSDPVITDPTSKTAANAPVLSAFSGFAALKTAD
ncbi:hypothetical protein BN2497_11427 [Janthinobacterium sp. CG23_2]|nr:hypothetical protein BN2497_11427 [Janthinobacterium sp. CG23_2]CUU32111.1 hypothetical protein BN3177_11427 [Janthinobacterium sp. CG23_2]